MDGLPLSISRKHLETGANSQLCIHPRETLLKFFSEIMGLEIKTLRYAHESGHTDVCYGSDNRNILTCGSDGNVRIWNGSDDDDPTADSVAEMALAVACYKDHFYVATDSNYVQAYSYADRKRDKIIFRFSAPVTHIAVSSSGKFIAACSCDMEFQVMNIETNKITTFTGHTAPILGVSLDPLDEYIVSSSCDGTVKIWEVESGSLMKTFSDMIPIKNDFFKCLCLGRTAWKSISGSLLAVPKDLEVIIFKRGTWDVNYKLSSSKIEKSISVVLFSPCGNYVTAASTSGEIIIWEIKHKSQVSYFSDPKKVGISGIAWHPDGSEIAFSDRLGRLGVLTGISEEISKHVVPEINIQSKETDVIDEYSEIVDPNTLFDDDHDEDDENCISLEKIKASYKNSSDNEDGPGSPDSFTSTKMSKEPLISLPKLQPPFQPSSTPSHFEPRCLCFNSVGIVRYYDSDKTIDVQFHDTMFHHALFLRSFGECTMATLNTNVLCLAVPSIDENLSKLSCLSLSSWAGNKEWSVYMPMNENILALAAGDSWVAVATDANHMRIFTNGGTQKQVVSLPGPVVCMSGFGQNLIVAFHQGMGVFESQNLGFVVYQIHCLCVRALIPFQPLPLSPKSVLKWLGFTDEGTPCSYDSEGVLRLLGHDLLLWSVAWSQSQKKSSDYHFVIGLSEKYQNVRCILCRNSQYPLVINSPTVLEIPLKIPLCALDTEKSVQEEIFWRLMFSLHTFGKMSGDRDYQTEAANFEKTLKQTALKLFADACRNSEDLRAIDVASFMSSHPLELAIKYATKVGKVYLAEKLNGISPVDWKNQYLQSFQYSMGASIGLHSFDRKLDDNVDKTLYSQQDMFEEYSTTVEKENTPKEQPSKNAPQPFKSSPNTPKLGSVNPFRKVQVQQEEPLKGLRFFDTLTKEVPKLTKPIIQNKKLKVKPLNSYKDKEPKTKKPTFVQWFCTRKTSLSEEYPNLSASELTKMGMKIYKDEMSKISGEENGEEDQSEVCVPESRKRSSEEVDGVNAKRSKSSDETF